MVYHGNMDDSQCMVYNGATPIKENHRKKDDLGVLTCEETSYDGMIFWISW